MAKRSDFAQKLLDDLRLRKERMGAGQSSNGSKSMASADSYTYSKRTYSSGSREMKTNQANGFRSGNAYNKSPGSNRSLSVEAASKQIVPFGKGRSSEPMGDLSMALAFALENGVKLRRMDSSGNGAMLGFLNQIGRQSVGLRKTERSIVIDRHHHSSCRFSTISNLHINEVAKGAQKLNEILRACSNDINLDSYSIEVGKELLKGAVDLEESLRMLVNLQEASEYMIKPQNKNRITLLDEGEEEDDDDNTIRKPDRVQLERPKFSFDKPSRNLRYFQEVTGTDLKQRLMALTYLSEATNSNHDRNSLSSSHSVSHKRSTSYGSSVRTPTAFSEQKNQSSSSKSKPEKGRIPNVIAKLMGLEELPENEEAKYGTQKESSSKQKIEGLALRKSAEGSSSRERKIKDAENLSSTTKKQRLTQHNHIQAIQDLHSLHAEKNFATRQTQNNHSQVIQDSHSLHAEKNLASRRTNFEATAQDRNQARNEKTGNQKGVQVKEKKQDNAQIREQKGKEERETKNLQQMMSQTQNGSVTMHKTEKRDANGLPSSHQTKSSIDLGLGQPSVRRESEPLDMKHHAGESGQQGTKQNIQVRKEKEREEMDRNLSQQKQEMLNFQKNHSRTNQSTPVRSSEDCIDALQAKVLPNNRYHEHPSQERNINISKISKKSSPTRNSNEDPYRKEEFPIKRGSIPSFLQEKPVHLPAPQKVKNPTAQKVETPRKIDELMARRKGNPNNLIKLQKHQSSLLNEVKHRKRDAEVKETEKLRTGRSKEAETCIVKSTKSAGSIQQPNELEELHFEAEQSTNLHNPSPDDAGRSTERHEIQATNENNENTISAAKSDQVPQQLDFDKDELTTHSTPLDPLNGNHEQVIKFTSLPQHGSKTIYELETPEPLSESENQLKQILTKNQLFLNTAEALFRLNIPFGILHAGTTDLHSRDEQSKLTLDTAYEVMTRKGRTQELICHPLMRIPIISSNKLRSLDELIKQMDKELKKLEFYGRNGNVECGVEDYLPKMIESDVYNWDPDVNSMWEFGWDMKMFGLVEKYELVKDVERFLINGILDEVTNDLVTHLLSVGGNVHVKSQMRVVYFA